MNFSAADLVKKSASQILYKEVKKIQYKATERQLKGNNYADKIVKKLNASDEKRGIIKLNNDDLLFFCIDMIYKNKHVEIKMVDNMDSYEQWYLNSSIVQSAFYASLLRDVKTLDTPQLRTKEGFKQEIVDVNHSNKFELWFGKIKYSIESNDSLKEHFIKKALLIKSCIETKDFDKCREFDKQYKFKEFDLFKPKFKKLK